MPRAAPLGRRHLAMVKAATDEERLSDKPDACAVSTLTTALVSRL